MIVRHAIAGDDGAGAVGTAAAVHEHDAVSLVIEHCERVRDLGFRGSADAFHRQVQVAHAGGFHRAFFDGDGMLAGWP